MGSLNYLSVPSLKWAQGQAKLAPLIELDVHVPNP